MAPACPFAGSAIVRARSPECFGATFPCDVGAGQIWAYARIYNIFRYSSSYPPGLSLHHGLMGVVGPNLYKGFELASPGRSTLVCLITPASKLATQITRHVSLQGGLINAGTPWKHTMSVLRRNRSETQPENWFADHMLKAT
eukprot:6194636-Pleurochrysis_carterae.AAC.5